MVLALREGEVERCVDMAEAIEAVEIAFRADAEGRAVNIPRSDMIVPLGADEAYVYKVMPGVVEDLGVAALRVQSDRIRWEEARKYKIGAARGDRYVQYVQVYDIETTEPVLIMPDAHASKLRVGATNALGAKHMADPAARSMALLGAGRHAGGQIEGLAAVLDLEVVYVFSPTRANREAFAAEWDDRLDADVVAIDTAREACRGVDVLACASNSMQPVFDADWIEPGMHVSAIKNPEVPDGAFHAVDRIGVTTRDLTSGPNNYAPRGSDFGERLTRAWTIEGFDLGDADELSHIVAEDRRRETDETTLFLNNVGLGMQFAAVGRVVYDRATEAGIGTEFDTEPFLQTVW